MRAVGWRSQVQDVTGDMGAYRVIMRLGSDAEAQTYLAIHTLSGSPVALTVLPAGWFQDTHGARMWQEVMARAAEITHPAIAMVLDWGIQDGQPYLVRRYYPGGTLGQQMRLAGPLPPEEVVARLADIAPALDHIYANGLVHHGLRPRALLRDESDRLVVGDFGLAEVRYHLQGPGPGMLPYVAPEVFLSAPSTPATDIYALGVTLYQMLTGRLPFEGVTDTQISRAHLNTRLEHVEDLSPAVVSVLRTAMSKLPTARYQSAGELLAALGSAVLGGNWEQARSMELARRPDLAAPVVRRQPAQVKAGRDSLSRLYVEALTTEHENPLEAVRLYRRIIEFWPHFAQGEVTERLHRLEQDLGVRRIPALLSEARERLSAQEWEAAEALSRHVLSYDPLHEEAQAIYAAAVAEASHRTHYRSASAAAQMGQWMMASRLLGELDAAGGRHLPDSAGLLVIREENLPYLREVAAVQTHAEQVLCLACSPDGASVVTGSTDRQARLWRLPDLHPGLRISDHANWVCQAQYSPDGSLLYTATWDGDVKIWSLPSGKYMGVIAGQAIQVRAMAISPQAGSLLATASGYFLTLWQMPQGKRQIVLRESDRHPVTAVGFSPDGRWLLSGAHNGYLRVRSAESLHDSPRVSARPAANPVYALTCSPDQQRIVMAYRDGRCFIVDFASGALVAELAGHRGAATTVAFAPTGAVLATGGRDRCIRLWRASDGALIRQIDGHAGPICGLGFSPDGRYLISSDLRGHLKVWGLARFS